MSPIKSEMFSYRTDWLYFNDGPDDSWPVAAAEYIPSPERIEGKPFVIMGDVDLVLKSWAAEQKLQLPADIIIQNWRTTVLDHLGKIFPQILVASDEYMSQTLDRNICLARSRGFVPISLDRIYTPQEDLLKFHITRSMDEEGHPKGYAPRFGQPAFETQALAIKEKVGDQPVALIDDAVVVGGTPCRAIDELKKAGVNVGAVYVAIATAQAKEKFAQKGIPLVSTCEVDAFEGLINESDLIPGLGGITVEMSDPQTGKPILGGAPLLYNMMSLEVRKGLITVPKPFEQDIAIFFHQQAIGLYEFIEAINDRFIYLSDVPRVPIGSPLESLHRKKIIDFLAQLDHSIKFTEYWNKHYPDRPII